MPRGEKYKYTDKQERKPDHIAEGYEKRGVGEKEAERRAWATVLAAKLALRALPPHGPPLPGKRLQPASGAGTS
jgi:plasmid stabilization system protein ParE